MTETAKERIYCKAPDKLIGDFDKRETLTVTIPMEEFDKLEKLALSAYTAQLSIISKRRYAGKALGVDLVKVVEG